MVTQIASDIEQIVLDWLEKKGIFDYQFQSSQMGGYFELGGSVVDFLFPERELAWRVQGDYWHRQVANIGRDMIQKEMLSAEGWTIVDIWGSTLDTPARINETLTKALQGEEVLQYA